MSDRDLTSDFKKLREPFAENQIGKLPRAKSKNSTEKRDCKECGGYHVFPAIHLDYVGHAAITDRLLQVDPLWTWEPFALASDGSPLISKQPDGSAAMWIKLTVLGVTRIGVGTVEANKTDVFKQLLSDALRNAGMRFGMALDLWSKEDLVVQEPEQPPTPAYEVKGWDSEQEWKDKSKELQDSIKDSPEAIQTEMRKFRTESNIDWPPSLGEYKQMKAHLDRLQQSEEIQEHLAPNSAEEASETVVGPLNSNQAEQKITEAFPGAQVVETYATQEEIEVVESYLQNLKDNDDKAAIRAWNKYAKEKDYPKDKSSWTQAQAKEAADFIEGL